MHAIAFEHVDVIFGDTPEVAMKRLDAGADREQIQAESGDIVAVQDANLTVREGEICVLMGLSGSGKSSLLRCVNGLNKVSRGAVWVSDKDEKVDIATCDRATLHRLRTERISMVFQQFALMPWRNVRENVALGLELSGLGKKEREAITSEKLHLVRLDEWAEAHPSELSGGMQQRVGLARALATDADILLMDEPFSALDPLIREHLQDELLLLQQELKKTILFVSHDLDEALKLGNIVSIMEAGRIVQTGSPTHIITHPANDYVGQFVASMNPLKVMTGSALMRPVERLENTGGAGCGAKLSLDGPAGITCSRSENGVPLEISCNHAPIQLLDYTAELNLNTLAADTMVAVTEATPMRTVVEIIQRTHLPVPVVTKEKRLLGVVGHEEILAGILK
ncbi:MAG: choline ABC transporter ATP-binding protein [Desulfosarcinaceae bacterium]